MNVKRNFERILERALSLLVVFLLLALSAVGGGRLLGRDIGAASAQGGAEPSSQPPTAEQLNALHLEGCTLQPADSATWTVVDRAGREAGVVISTAAADPDGTKAQRGFAGPVPLLMYVDSRETIAGFVLLPNQDTPPFIDKVRPLLQAYRGLPVGEALGLRVDAVSGATYSSNGLLANVRLALERYAARREAAVAAPAIGWGKTAAVALVALAGMAVALRWRHRRTLRIAVLLLNIGVMGFWTGQLLSLSLLRGWMMNGLDPLGALPAVLLVAVAVLMPCFGQRNYYCSWVCPYGALQELAWRVPAPKLRVSAAAYKWLRRVRLGLLLLLLMALWMGVGAALLDYEPFGAFLVAGAGTGVLVLAGGFVALGLFVPRPWCTAVCPLGMLLNLAEEGGSATATAGRKKEEPKATSENKIPLTPKRKP